MTKPHEYYMSQALELAREAADAKSEAKRS